MIDPCSSIDSMSVPEFIGDVDETTAAKKRIARVGVGGDSVVVPDMLFVKVVPGGFDDGDFPAKDHSTSEDDTVIISSSDVETGKCLPVEEIMDPIDHHHDETARVVTPEKSIIIETQEMPPPETTCIDLDALMDAMESNGTSTEPIDCEQSNNEESLLPAAESNGLNMQSILEQSGNLDRDDPLPLGEDENVDLSSVCSGKPTATDTTIDFDEILEAELADRNESLTEEYPASLEEQIVTESTPAVSTDGKVRETKVVEKANEHSSLDTPSARSAGNSEETKPEETFGDSVDEELVGAPTANTSIEMEDVTLESMEDRLASETQDHEGLVGTVEEDGQQEVFVNPIIESGTNDVLVEEEDYLACVSDSQEENSSLKDDGEEIVFHCETSEPPAVNEEGEATIRFDLIDSFECMAAEAEAELDALLQSPSSSEEPKTPETKSNKPEPVSIVSKRTEAKKKGKQRVVVPHRTPPIRQWNVPANLFQAPATPPTDETTPPKRKMREPIFKDFRPTVPVPFRLRTEERFLARNCPCCAHKKKSSPISVVTATNLNHSSPIQPTRLTKKY